MSKRLELTYKGTDYVLEFTRDTVRRMERNGFAIDEKKFMTFVPELFAGAFMANHRWVKRDLIDEIFDTLPNKVELINKLIEMYNEPYNALVEDPEENEGNASWAANW